MGASLVPPCHSLPFCTSILLSSSSNTTSSPPTQRGYPWPRGTQPFLKCLSGHPPLPSSPPPTPTPPRISSVLLRHALYLTYNMYAILPWAVITHHASLSNGRQKPCDTQAETRALEQSHWVRTPALPTPALRPWANDIKSGSSMVKWDKNSTFPIRML